MASGKEGIYSIEKDPAGSFSVDKGAGYSIINV